MLTKVFGPMKKEVKEKWTKLHNGQRHDLHCSPNITRKIKLRSVRRAGCLARMGETGMHTEFLEGKHERKRALE
jgi:hypothetical protein